jgi:hypothetical protein
MYAMFLTIWVIYYVIVVNYLILIQIDNAISLNQVFRLLCLSRYQETNT